VRDVLGTVVLGILAGHWRYAHLTALRGDTVSAELLGMSRVVSEDAVRRGLSKIDHKDGAEWLHRYLRNTVSPIRQEPWILDCDTMVKPLYGHQEGAVVGYNPHKPGRPSHAYHSFQISSARLILDVMVTPGNQHTSKHFRAACLGAAGSTASGLLAGICPWRQGLGQRAQHDALRARRYAVSF
jgi:hypothetical protein